MQPLLELRFAHAKPSTFSISINDYGFELLCAPPFDREAQFQNGLLPPNELDYGILASLKCFERTFRIFRKIARVSGLVFPMHARREKSARRLQVSSEPSSGLLYGIFRGHDCGNLLSGQTDTEVLWQGLGIEHIRFLPECMNTSRVVMHPGKPTPLAFPLTLDACAKWATRRGSADRVERMRVEFEKAA
ncbi:hypothetical protein [Paraburkholderia susongensis]|uniref:hypothetical protein n=1 Tax=Paraburkholderia susongensis TaxID=1515439 RepID=UPI001FC986F4|nr:hypothetical protein [Paraburkholderia susongensis]